MDEKKNKTSKRFSRSFLWIIQSRRGIVVKVGKGRRLPKAEFRATINELKKMGFKFDPDTKTWRKRS
jgi:hypothetical protein